jgi:hypothetical protein
VIGAILVTGNHPRHFYVAAKLSESVNLKKVFVENRGAITPEFVDDLTGRVGQIARLHYGDREDWEHRFESTPRQDTNFVNKSNWSDVADALSLGDVQVVFTFGCSLVPSSLLDSKGVKFINFHGGLSPWYKGALTTFWPSYFLQPERTGYTIHETTELIDGGRMFARVPISLDQGLSLNGIAFNATLEFSKSLPDLIRHIEVTLQSGVPPKQQGSGKLFLSTDWSPAHLLHIYEEMENRPLLYASSLRELELRCIELL